MDNYYLCVMRGYLYNDIKFLPGVGERRAMLLRKELKISTMRDLLYYFPRRYIDRTKVYKVREVTEDAPNYIQLRVRVESFAVHGEGRKKRLIALASDDTGGVELTWFGGLGWVEKQLERGREYIVFGRPGFFNHELQMVHPELEAVDAPRHKGNMQGIYSTTETLTANYLCSKGIYNLICKAWENARNHIVETLPEWLMREQKLMPLNLALQNIHFPENPERLRQAERRLKFEELLGVQLGILSERTGRMARCDGFLFPTVGDKFTRFFNECIPFELTGAQKRVIKEIRSDTVSGFQMNRLLQGDVGSGKTLVALLSMLLAADNAFQSCMMAPTEILARQHFATVKKMLGDMPVRVEVLTGSTTAKERRAIHEGLRDGSVDILIGTHALIEDTVQFANLGFVVIDEQHRFGVEQRARLWTKNHQPPHVLVMTATPIPRTLAMTMYGDLDVSVIDELPPGRKPIKTIHLRDSDRLRVMGFMQRQIAAGRQVYVVYPLIAESESMDYKDLQDGFESLSQQFPPPGYFITVVHGRLSAEVKERNMMQFKDGVAHIMVATTVIEVGVDVPNATVMVIESAERFGLSQLHQLRGRVGRGGGQSYCILMSGDKLSHEARKRLEAMVRTNDGFELSELDLQLRGSGDLSGTMQSGQMFDLKIASPSRDAALVEHARTIALSILEKDPELADPQLKELKQRYFSKKDSDFSRIS